MPLSGTYIYHLYLKTNSTQPSANSYVFIILFYSLLNFEALTPRKLRLNYEYFKMRFKVIRDLLLYYYAIYLMSEYQKVLNYHYRQIVSVNYNP